MPVSLLPLGDATSKHELLILFEKWKVQDLNPADLIPRLRTVTYIAYMDPMGMLMMFNAVHDTNPTWSRCPEVSRDGNFPGSTQPKTNRKLTTWWLIPLSKWVIIPVINGISRLNPLITGVITHLLSGMNHQVPGLGAITRGWKLTHHETYSFTILGESSHWSHRRSQDPVDAFKLTPRLKGEKGGRFQKKHLRMSMNIGDIQKLMLLLCESLVKRLVTPCKAFRVQYEQNKLIELLFKQQNHQNMGLSETSVSHIPMAYHHVPH